jgi:hypothetical protein
MERGSDAVDLDVIARELGLAGRDEPVVTGRSRGRALCLGQCAQGDLPAHLHRRGGGIDVFGGDSDRFGGDGDIQMD